MTVIDAPAAPSAWSWWERRRLAYNIALFVTGWAGFGLQVAASHHAGEPMDLPWIVLGQGLIYIFYMAAANVLYLLGAVLEAVLKPHPMEGYRRAAWAMGTGLAVLLPLAVAAVFSLVIAGSTTYVD